MNEFDIVEFKNVIDSVNPFHKTIYLLIAGFIFSSFHIQFLYLVGNIISAVFFFLGLRIVKNANRSFRLAYYLSILFLGICVVEIAIAVTPLAFQKEVNHFFSLLAIIRIFKISQGLNNYVKDKMYAWNVFICYLLLYALGVFGSSVSNLLFLWIVIFVFVFIIMIKQLLACKKYLINYSYDPTLVPLRISSFRFITVYAICTLIIMFVTHFSYPFILYEHMNSQSLENKQYTLIEDYKNKDKHSSLQVYDYDQDHYLYIYKLTTNHIKKPVRSITMDIYHNSSMANNLSYKIKNIIVSDGDYSYKVNQIHQQSDDINASHMYKAYLKPNFQSCYTIQIEIITHKGMYKNEEYLEEKLRYSLMEDFFNIYYSYYDMTPSFDKNSYDVYDQIKYQTEAGKVFMVFYNE